MFYPRKNHNLDADAIYAFQDTYRDKIVRYVQQHPVLSSCRSKPVKKWEEMRDTKLAFIYKYSQSSDKLYSAYEIHAHAIYKQVIQRAFEFVFKYGVWNLDTDTFWADVKYIIHNTLLPKHQFPEFDEITNNNGYQSLLSPEKLAALNKIHKTNYESRIDDELHRRDTMMQIFYGLHQINEQYPYFQVWADIDLIERTTKDTRHEMERDAKKKKEMTEKRQKTLDDCWGKYTPSADQNQSATQPETQPDQPQPVYNYQMNEEL